MTTIEAGTRAYDIDGRELEYVAPVGSQHAIRYVLDAGGEDEYLDKTRIVDCVFATPPTERIHAEIGRLNAELESIRARLKAARDEDKDLKTEQGKRAAILAQHKATARITDFIEGKITHFVFVQYSGVRIETTAKALASDESNWPKKQKLFVLYGDPDRSLQWRLNHYSDGSGSSCDVIPCLSFEEARSEARAAFARMFVAKNCNGYPEYNLGRVAESARAHGFEVPAGIAAQLRAAALTSAQGEVAAAEKKAADARAVLAALEAVQ